MNILLHYIKKLPIALSSPEEAFPMDNGEVTKCEPFDWLPSIIQTVTPSVKKTCLSSSPEVISVTLAYLNSVLDGGFIYGADYVEIAVQYLLCPQRTVESCSSTYE